MCTCSNLVTGFIPRQPTVTLTGDTGTGADATVALPDVIVSELDTDGNCTVTYDPEDQLDANGNPGSDGKRYIPQMLFTWPVTPTIGLDVNGDTNADYYLYTNEDGASQVMTNSDGSGAVAKLIVKNPMIDETNDLLYEALDYGQVIGFDVLNNNTIANNILGKIALDRADPAYFVDRGNPMPIISPIRNNEFYAAPMDVNILCSDRVACNAIAYSLFRTGELGPHNNPNFSNINLDATGVDYSGTMHAIKPGDSGTISFQNLPFGNYVLKYMVRDAAGRTSGVQQITFTIGRKPDISIISVQNRYVSLNVPANPASFQWTADTGSLVKPFRYLIAVNGSCIGYTRQQYLTPPVGVITGGPFTSGSTVTTNISATATGMQFNDTNHGINYITICAITCEVGTCNALGDLSVWGDAFETVIRDDTAPSITASPLSGMFSLPQQIFLSGSTTVAGVPANGSLVPNEICYTWGADASGNPQPGLLPGDPVFPCPTANNVVKVSGSSTQLNLGCNSRASVTDINTNPNACPFTPGIYYLKFIARDAAGNATAVQTQAYAVGVTPQITTNQAPHQHVWSAHAGWGNNGDATLPAPALASGQTLRSQTTWTWQTDFPGTYQVRINDGTLDCTGGTLSTHASASGSVVALSPVSVTILAADLNVDINTVKVCYWPSGGGPVNSASMQIWELAPVNFNSIADVSGQNVARFNIGENPDISLADLYTPVSAIQSITFTCPAGSTGVDANDGCTQPTAIGAVVRPGVNTIYRLPAQPANRVTTLPYDVRITVCNTSACSAAAGPTFGTEATAPYNGSATVKVFVMQNKTAGESIFVDNATGNDTNAGTVRTAPKRSLSSAAAAATGGKAIYIVGGTYCGNGVPFCTATTGTLTLPSGTSLYGGFNSSWYRPDVANNRANITAGTGSFNTADSIGIQLGAVNTAVSIEGINLTAQAADPIDPSINGYNTVALKVASGTSTLTLYKNSIQALGPAVPTAGAQPGSTYGIHIMNLNSLVMTNNTVSAGHAWPGANGGLGGVAGTAGGNGNNGTGGSCDGGCPIFGCGGCQQGGAGGNGGSSPVFNNGGNGGRGGAEDSCVGSGNGANGTSGLPSTAFGNGGGDGNPGNQGGDGTTGPSGSSGTGGSGGSGGTVASGLWAGVSGGSGTNGTNGGGGGGGGGGGAQWSGAADNGPGNGGGGGGGGGSLGSGGAGGHAGGASIAVFLHGVPANLNQNTLTSSNGGNGGNGQAGGAGGPGGTAGMGATQCLGEIRRGGNGGAGGDGGGGGSGGGGQGGPSIGLSVYNAPLTCAGNSATPGVAGNAGTGANNGAAGISAACYDFVGNSTCNCN
jgi:hypothetical protein